MKKIVCNCLALYCAETSQYDTRRIYEYLLQWFRQIVSFPDTIGITGEGFPEEPMALSDAEATLQQQQFHGVKSIELYTTVPGYKQLVFGWKVSAYISASNRMMIIAYDTDLLAHTDVASFTQVVKDVAHWSKILYGIGYQRDKKKGPVFYALGMLAGLGYSREEMPERNQITRWMDERIGEKRYFKGFLRDIYPLNILSASHLKRIIGNQSLQQWILSSRDHGQLEQILDELWIWRLSDRQIPAVKNQLKEQNILLCS